MPRRAKPVTEPVVFDGSSPWAEEKHQQYRARGAKRAALLRAAALEFSQRGFSRVTLDDIAAQLGVSKPTIYYHVGDKDDLFSACSEAAAEGLFALFADLATNPRPAEQALKAFVQAYVGIVTGPFGYCLVMTEPAMLTRENQARWQERLAQITDGLRRILEQGVTEGRYKPTGLDSAVSIIAGALNWIVRWYDPDEHQPKKIADSFLRSFEAILGR